MTARPWYTPAGMLARMAAKVVRSAKDPQYQILGLMLYGSADLLGVQGTIALIFKLRRQHNARTKKQKAHRNQAAVPRV
jgi:hypothetical protein